MRRRRLQQQQQPRRAFGFASSPPGAHHKADPAALPPPAASPAFGSAANFPSLGSAGWRTRRRRNAGLSARAARARTLLPPRSVSRGRAGNSGHQQLSGNNAKGVPRLLTSEQRFEKDSQAHVFS